MEESYLRIERRQIRNTQKAFLLGPGAEERPTVLPSQSFGNNKVCDPLESQLLGQLGLEIHLELR